MAGLDLGLISIQWKLPMLGLLHACLSKFLYTRASHPLSRTGPCGGFDTAELLDWGHWLPVRCSRSVGRAGWQVLSACIAAQTGSW